MVLTANLPVPLESLFLVFWIAILGVHLSITAAPALAPVLPLPRLTSGNSVLTLSSDS